MTGEEAAVHREGEALAPQRALEAARQVEGVQRQDAALLGVDDEKAVVAAAFGHGKHAPAIAGDQILGSERLHGAIVPEFARRFHAPRTARSEDPEPTLH